MIKKTLTIELRRKSTYRKVRKISKYCQTYKNIWYSIFRYLRKRNQFDLKQFNSVSKLKAFLDSNCDDDYVQEAVNHLRDLYYRLIGADTCKSLHKEIVQEVRSWAGKRRNGDKRANLPKVRDVNRLYKYTLSVNPNMVHDKRQIEGKIAVRLGKSVGAIKIPVPEWLRDAKIHIKIGFVEDCPVIIYLTYETVEPNKLQNLNPEFFVSIDLGVNNLMTCYSNHPNLKTFIYSGKPLKTVNQLVNKLNADNSLSLRDKRRLWRWRDRFITHYMYTVANHFVDIVEHFDIGTAVMPQKTTELYQQKSKMSKQSNQNTRMIPLGKLRQILISKLEEKGVEVISKIDESYTSSVSIYDQNNLVQIIKKNYKEITVNPATYRRKGLLVDHRYGCRLHADVNGAINIAVKHFGMIVLRQLFTYKYYNVKLHNPIVFRNLTSLRSPLDRLSMGLREVAQDHPGVGPLETMGNYVFL